MAGLGRSRTLVAGNIGNFSLLARNRLSQSFSKKQYKRPLNLLQDATQQVIYTGIRIWQLLTINNL